METLSQITAMDFLKVPKIHLDRYQQEIRENIFLEFFLEKCRVLITPEYDYITTGHAASEEMARLETILQEKSELLNKFKDYLLYDLSYYSALLETNSYYITANRNLIIARILTHGDPSSFIVKLYTLSRGDLPENYNDKIYLGRDQLSLKNVQRNHFGLKFITASMIEQFLKMKERIKESLNEFDYREIDQEYLEEMEETIGDFAELAQEIQNNFSVDISRKSLENEALIQANVKFRNLKHILIEIDDSLREMATRLFEENNPHVARYVTKFNKDITNDINFIMIKVNGRISDAINKIHV